MKVRSAIMIAAIFFAIVPMLVYTALNVNFISKSGQNSFNSDIIEDAKNEVPSLRIILENAQHTIATVENINSVRLAASNNSNEQIIEQADIFLNTFVSENTMISAARLINSDGKIVAGTKGTNGDDKFDSFEGYKTSEQNTLVFDKISANTQQNQTMYIQKVIGNGYRLVISYTLAGVDNIIRRITENSSVNGADGSILIVDSNGNWSEGNNINENISANTSENIGQTIKGLADGGVSQIINYTNNNKNYTAAIANVGGATGLSIVVRRETAAVSGGSFTTFIIAAVIVGIISIVAAIIVSGVLTSPLKKIQETLGYIRNGDHEARIGNVANNEYGQLSRAFNNVIDEIVVSEDRYKNISEMSDNIIFEWNFKTNEVVFSNNFNKKFSYRASSDHFGDSFLLKAKLHPDDADRYRRDLDQLEKGVGFAGNEYRIKNIYGDFIWVLIRTEALKDKDGKPVKVVGVIVDIDRAKKSEQQLTEKASFDALTELYNRETIENQINNEISLSEVRKSEMAVLFVDVDDFKHFNDNYSHAVGDEVLKFVASTIKSEVENIGFAGRYGGDEFIVLVRNTETNNPAPIAERIISKLSNGFDPKETEDHLSVSVSIGIAVIKDDYNTRVEYLIGKADDAMYSVKKNGKSNYAFI